MHQQTTPSSHATPSHLVSQLLRKVQTLLPQPKLPVPEVTESTWGEWEQAMQAWATQPAQPSVQ